MLGNLISAGASLLGGWMSGKQADKQQNLQKQFAKNAISWKVDDAKNAGVSPLFALGAPTTSYAPVGVGGGMAGAMESAGQNIGRAVDAQASPAGRAGHLAVELAQAQLEGVKADNDLKRAELLSRSNLRSQPGTGPAVLDGATLPHIPGQGNSEVEFKSRIQPSSPDFPQKSFGTRPEVDMYKTTHGHSPQVPQELGEAMESQPLSAIQWAIRNNILPIWDAKRRTPPHPAPEGHYWSFNPLIAEYTLKKLSARQDRRIIPSYGWND